MAARPSGIVINMIAVGGLLTKFATSVRLALISKTVLFYHYVLVMTAFLPSIAMAQMSSVPLEEHDDYLVGIIVEDVGMCGGQLIRWDRCSVPLRMNNMGVGGIAREFAGEVSAHVAFGDSRVITPEFGRSERSTIQCRWTSERLRNRIDCRKAQSTISQTTRSAFKCLLNFSRNLNNSPNNDQLIQILFRNLNRFIRRVIGDQRKFAK